MSYSFNSSGRKLRYIYLCILLLSYLGGSLFAKEIVFVDKGVQGYDTITKELFKEYHFIDTKQDGLAQVAHILQTQKELDAIHIISHGNSGELLLGDSKVNSTTLQNYSNEFKIIQESLKENGDILLYGCNVASGQKGEEFINSLATLTSANIGASTNLTGNSKLGGDWVLEVNNHISKSLNLDYYQYSLATPSDGLYTFTGAVDNGDGTFRTSDSFFTISASDGYTVDGVSPVSADGFGAFIYDASAPSSGTSYIEIAVNGGGSFTVTDAVIGDYEPGASSTNNNFYNVYAVGYANGVQVAITPAKTSEGVYDTDLDFDFSNFSGKLIDTFRVYYSWNDSTTNQTGFNLESMTIAGASTTPVIVLTDINGTLLTTNTFDRPKTLADDGMGDYATIFYAANPGDVTGLMGGTFNYFTRDVTPQADGNYTFAVTDSHFLDTSNQVTADTFLLLYDTSFDPTNPLTNLILAIDDGTTDNNSGSLWSTFTHTLVSGHKYVLVLTSYTAGTNGSLTVSVTGPAAVTVAANEFSSDAPASDTTAPTFDIAPATSGVASTTLNLNSSLDENGTVYYITVANGATAPTSAQVKAGVNYTGGTVVAHGSGATSGGGFDSNLSVSGLTASTAYDIYVVAQDDESTPNLQATPTKVDVTTAVASSGDNATFDYEANLTGSGTTTVVQAKSGYTLNATIDGTNSGTLSNSLYEVEWNPADATESGAVANTNGNENSLFTDYVDPTDAVSFSIAPISGQDYQFNLSSLVLADTMDGDTTVVLTGYDANGAKGTIESTLTGYISVGTPNNQVFPMTLDIANNAHASFFQNITSFTITLKTPGSDTGIYVAVDNVALTNITPVTVTALPDTTPPTVTSVTVPSNGTYKATEVLSFTVNTNENVTVTGTPRIALTIGSTTKYATYASGTGTSALVFSYTVESALLDTDGITVGALSLNSGTMKDSANNDMNLTLNSVGATTSILVDSIDPTVSTYSPTSSATSVPLNGDIVLTFSENVVKGTGNIVIKRYSDDTTLQTIDVTSGAVVVSSTTATISHSTAFALNTQYYVTVDATAFDDANGNSFGGITSKDTLKFTSVSNQTPTIGGITTTTTIDDNGTTSPFSGVTIADYEDDNVTVTVTLDTTAKGVFTTASLSASGFSDGGNGSYSLSSTTLANAQSAIRQLVFNPTNNRIAVNGTEITTFTITVNDGNSNGTNNTTTITSTSVNDAPTLTGTPNTTVNQDVSYSFTPSASDVDLGQTLTFSVTNKPSWADFNTTTGKLSGTPTNSDVGTISAIVISVTDSIATTNLASFNLQVANLNDAPTLGTISNVTKSEDFTTFNVTITPADIDGDNLKLSVDMNDSSIIQIPTNSTDWIPSGNYSGGLPLPITAIANKSGVVELNVTVEDSSGATTSQLFTITVNPSDDAPVALSMAATVGPNSQNTFNTFTPNFSDAEGNYPIMLKIVTLPTVGTFEDFNRSGDGSWTTITTAPFEVAMSDLANYRFNAGNNNGLTSDVNWSIMTSYDNTYTHGLWSNVATGVVTIIDPALNHAPDVNITMDGDDINGTTVTIDEDGDTQPIYITFSDDYTPTAFLVGVIDSNDSSKVSLNDGDFNITRISDNNVSVIITPKANVYGDINITMGAFDGDKNGTKSFTLHINSVNDTPIAMNFEKTIDEDTNYSFSTLNPTTVYSDTNDSSQNSNETYPDIFQIVSLPQHGRLHLGDNVALVADTNVSLENLGNLVYTPEENNNTDVTFTWRAYDGESWTEIKTATIIINAVDDSPILNAISNVTKQEDASDFNITLVSSDVEGHTITYTTTSSNPSIATVSIVNGKVVVTPIGNKSGTVIVEVNATANGKTATQQFEVSISSTNDTPTIETSFSTISILEDSGVTNIELGVSDIDGDDLNVTVSSSNENLVRVTPNWNGLVNIASYQGLDFNVTTVPNANGVATITVTVKDTTGATDTTTFDINVTAVNDAPALSAISDMYVYKNSSAQSIELGIVNVDNDTLTYTAKHTNKSLISGITFNDNNMTISIKSDASGQADINVTVSDGELNSSKVFSFNVLALKEDDTVKTGGTVSVDENQTVTVKFVADNITVTAPTQPDVNGSISHEIDFGTQKVTATSDINGSVVEVTDNGVKTTFEDTTTHVKAEVNATITGKASHTLTTTNGKTTTATSNFVGANTVIKKDNSDKVEIETSVAIDVNTTVTVTAHENGTAEHTVATNGKTTKATSDVVGASTLITSTGTVETSAGDVNATQVGYKIKALALTKPDGTTTTSFIKVDSTGTTVEVMGNTVTTATPFGAGNSVEIKEIGGTLYIKTSAPLDANLVIE